MDSHGYIVHNHLTASTPASRHLARVTFSHASGTHSPGARIIDVKPALHGVSNTCRWRAVFDRSGDLQLRKDDHPNRIDRTATKPVRAGLALVGNLFVEMRHHPAPSGVFGPVSPGLETVALRLCRCPFVLEATAGVGKLFVDRRRDECLQANIHSKAR